MGAGERRPRQRLAARGGAMGGKVRGRAEPFPSAKMVHEYSHTSYKWCVDTVTLAGNGA